MIIFGWNHQTIWFIGLAFRIRCDHCNNEEFWGLSRRTTWFTLFFIPVIPYKTEWLLTCPICKYGTELDSAQVKKIKPIAEANQQLVKGEITEHEHELKIATLNDVPVMDNAPQALPQPQELPKQRSIFCSKCGTELSSQENFCANCGTKVNKLV